MHLEVKHKEWFVTDTRCSRGWREEGGEVLDFIYVQSMTEEQLE